MVPRTAIVLRLALAFALFLPSLAQAGEIETVVVTKARTLDNYDPDPYGLIARDQHRVVAPLFPGASFVRVYRCMCWFYPDQMLARNQGWDKSVMLSRDEIALLRRSVFYAPEPLIWSACVYPNQYGFLFFDRSRRLIGMVASNATFEHVQIVPANPPSDDMKDIMVDAANLKAIVDDHSEVLRNLGC